MARLAMRQGGLTVYAIIEDSGRQLRVSEGDVVDVDLRELDEAAKQVTFDRVLLVADAGSVKVGTPVVKGAKVVAEIVADQVKGQKITIRKLRRRKGYRRKIGHRQRFLRVRVSKIVA
jgi:large subunit ribosomal protein L21